MNYSNPPRLPPRNITHETFYSQVFNHEIGYNIYLPPGYRASGKSYPVAYHFHGWKGNESSDIRALRKAYRGREAIIVFVNAISSADGYWDAVRQIETVLTEELVPHIDGQYRTDGNRTLSGFSMGGMLAFHCAVKYPGLFGRVTAYAGTYHHQYHKGYHGVGEPPEKAAGLFEAMMGEKRYLEEPGILHLVRQNADKIRGSLRIDIHVGTKDILICDNEIMHLYLNSLEIAHTYKEFPGVGHELRKIL